MNRSAYLRRKKQSSRWATSVLIHAFALLIVIFSILLTALYVYNFDKVQRILMDFSDGFKKAPESVAEAKIFESVEAVAEKPKEIRQRQRATEAGGHDSAKVQASERSSSKWKESNNPEIINSRRIEQKPVVDGGMPNEMGALRAQTTDQSLRVPLDFSKRTFWHSTTFENTRFSEVIGGSLSYTVQPKEGKLPCVVKFHLRSDFDLEVSIEKERDGLRFSTRLRTSPNDTEVVDEKRITKAKGSLFTQQKRLQSELSAMLDEEAQLLVYLNSRGTKPIIQRNAAVVRSNALKVLIPRQRIAIESTQSLINAYNQLEATLSEITDYVEMVFVSADS